MQSQNEEMRKHMERMENGIMRKKKGVARPAGSRVESLAKPNMGTREIRESGRRLFGTPPLRQNVCFNKKFFRNYAEREGCLNGP